MRLNDDVRRIAILTSKADTLYGLEAYLRNVGLRAESRRSLDIAALNASSTRAIVVFPDDFPDATIKTAMQALLGAPRDTLTLIITYHPALYEAMLGVERAGVVVLPGPVWGWAIVDAIRHHEEARTARG